MCANCKHTGGWLFLCILFIFAAVSTNSQATVCNPNQPQEYDLNTLSFSLPVLQAIIKETGATFTANDLKIFVDQRTPALKAISCTTLYNYISTFQGNATQEDTTTEDPHGHVHEEAAGAFNVKPVVWIASTVAVVIISAVGLLGVAVVPLVNKSYYNDVIQFLVALAVGCLTGDAFLHLLPHAIAGGHNHSHEAEADPNAASEEREAVLKGLVALLGIYFFFLAEKMVSTVSEYRAEKAVEKEERERVLKNPRKSVDGIRRLSTFRESISVSSYRRSSRLTSLPDGGLRRPSRVSASVIADDILTTGLTAKAMKTVDVLNAYIEEGDEEEDSLQKNQGGNLTLQVPVLQVQEVAEKDKKTARPPVAHGHGHGHSHAIPIKKDDESVGDTFDDNDAACDHGHSHDFPRSMASVAWMVIMGDGLHNFTDGMAIGVAFTASIAGGISTTVAVFCHELPHELGDFAVLLKTGMKIKQALFFNVVSSVLCLFGMLVGIGVGNVESASSWIFAFTAGTFVYIALVDMLPELSSFQIKPDRSRIVQMLIQNVGLIVGAGIMLLIAIYEEQLLNMVG